MAQTFNCPSCGASLGYEGGDDPVVRCSYCDSIVIAPEELRPQSREQQPLTWTATPIAGAPLTIDLRGLTGKVAKLKAIRQLVREGQVPEAAQVYQEAFGVSSEEAEDVVDRLASGQGVVISGATFSQPVPVVSGAQVQVVSGEQVTRMLAEQMNVAQQWQRQVNRIVSCVLVLVLLTVLVSIILAVAGSSIVAQLF